MRENINEIERLFDQCAVDLHRGVVARKGYAMLVIVGVGRILEIPARACKLHRDLAQILARGLRCAARISDVFVAEIAKRISALLLRTQGGDDLGILFGL